MPALRLIILSKEYEMNKILKDYIEKKMARLHNDLGRNSNRVKNEWIVCKEEKFGIVLPVEYKWFIQSYDFIFIWGESTKTIFPIEQQDESDQDIFNTYFWNLDLDRSNEDKLFFLESDIGSFFFKIKNGIASDEVYLYDSNDDEYSLYAPTFLSFLKKEISYCYKE